MNLLEAEQFAIERPPLVHAAAIDVVSEVVEIIEADALWFWVMLAQPLELVVIGGAFRTVFVDEVQQRSANSDYGRYVERLVRTSIWRGPLGDGVVKRVLGIHHPPRHRRRARAVLIHEVHGMRTALGIEQIGDVALAPDGDVLGAMAGYQRVAHALEQCGQLLWLAMCEFNEFEAVGAGRIGFADAGWRCVVRKGTHRGLHHFERLVE